MQLTIPAEELFSFSVTILSLYFPTFDLSIRHNEIGKNKEEDGSRFIRIDPTPCKKKILTPNKLKKKKKSQNFAHADEEEVSLSPSRDWTGGQSVVKCGGGPATPFTVSARLSPPLSLSLLRRRLFINAQKPSLPLPFVVRIDNPLFEEGERSAPRTAGLDRWMWNPPKTFFFLLLEPKERLGRRDP